MKNNHLPKDFTSRFREENLADFFGEQQRYEDFYFRQYAGEKHEIGFLGRPYIQKMSDRMIINRLINKIEKDSCEEYRRLSAYMEKFKNVLIAGMKEEPYVCHYFQALLGIVTPFQLLIATFRENVQRTLLDKLQSMAGTGDCNNAGAESEDIDAVIIVIEQYADELQHYYDAFDAFLYRETKGACGTAVTTQIEQCLISVITLLERSLMTGETVQLFLELWKMRIAVREMQEICN